jgi:putative copper export protein
MTRESLRKPGAPLRSCDTPLRVPNWTYLLVSFVFHLGLALWIGGMVVLGMLVAPVLFGNFDGATAGASFGPILRRFSRLRSIALPMVIAAMVAKHLLWETHAVPGGSGKWIFLRVLAVFVMALTLAHDLNAETSMERLRERMTADPADPSRIAFGKLHKRSEASMKVALVAGLVALFFS